MNLVLSFSVKSNESLPLRLNLFDKTLVKVFDGLNLGFGAIRSGCESCVQVFEDALEFGSLDPIFFSHFLIVFG